MNSISIIINWSGPFSFSQACLQKKQGLYLVHGRNKLGANPNYQKFLYCGISDRDIGKRIGEHKLDSFNHPDNTWWIGRQVFPKKRSRKIIELAEWIIIYFAGTEHNCKKIKNLPSQEIFLINEWYFPCSERRRIKNVSVMQYFSDVICWSPDTRLVREGDLSVWKH